jgi:transcriptional regulator with XRE-family HTH domain
VIDHQGLGSFLRRRRLAVTSTDAGFVARDGRDRGGLRREQVAVLCGISADYYARLETGQGRQPSRETVSALAEGLRLTPDERDHLFHLSGYTAPERDVAGPDIDPGLLRMLTALENTPAEIIDELGRTLRQNPLSIALTGDAGRYHGRSRSIGYRWFADPSARAPYPTEDHPALSRAFVAALRELVAVRGPDSEAAGYAATLLLRSDEFASLWEEHRVGDRPSDIKRFAHPDVGVIELECQVVVASDRTHRLRVYTARPGSSSAEKLRLLAVLGPDALR